MDVCVNFTCTNSLDQKVPAEDDLLHLETTVPNSKWEPEATGPSKLQWK